MILFRIAAVGKSYGADDKSGAGAARSPGRWNLENEFVLYCAPARSMAVLETAAHVTKPLPLNKYLVEVDVPDDLWQSRELLSASSAPVGWDAIPAGKPSVAFGSAWYNSQRSCLLQVPSAIVPEESCVIVNCTHVSIANLALRVMRKHTFESLLGR